MSDKLSIFKKEKFGWEFWLDDSNSGFSNERLEDIENQVIKGEEQNIPFSDFVKDLVADQLITRDDLPCLLGVFFQKADKEDGKTVWIIFSSPFVD